MVPEQDRQPREQTVRQRRVIGGAIWFGANAVAAVASTTIVLGNLGNPDYSGAGEVLGMLLSCVGPIGLNLVVLAWLARTDRERFVGALMAIATLFIFAMVAAAACFGLAAGGI